jgi:hypothetical protein
MIATFHFVEIATTDYESRKNADRENSSRPAVVEITQESHGVGQYRLKKPLIFPVVFRTEPHFTFGSAAITGPEPAAFHDPRGSSGVWGWQRNKGGQYTGAYCWLRVDCEQISTSGGDLSKVVVQHYLSFSAVAIKNVPAKTRSPSLTPRPVGL